MRRASALTRCCALTVFIAPAGVVAQSAEMLHRGHAHPADSSGRVRVFVEATANGVLTHVSPAYATRSFTELQLVQPVLMSHVSWQSLAFDGVINAEGYTLRRGELDPGIFGEGYVDRRHPHTLLHEAMIAWRAPTFRMPGQRVTAAVSLAAGKGFVPFGSDDPMMRPIEKYPVNHHHSQIIERVQAVVAGRLSRNAQAASVEYARFNGDEPVGPFAGPEWSRFGDSWAARATVQLAEGVELSASQARVKSPEIQQGGAFDHAQHHASFRVDRANSAGNSYYLLAEWARTDEITNNRVAFRYYSWLVEGAHSWHGFQGALRSELTDRAEQSRLLDPFREPLGHIDFQILGITRWQVSTVALSAPACKVPATNARVRVAPFVETARSFPTPRNRPTVFEPSLFYGRPTIWSLSLGLRLTFGDSRMRAMHAEAHERMGRYGVMSDQRMPQAMQHDM